MTKNSLISVLRSVRADNNCDICYALRHPQSGTRAKIGSQPAEHRACALKYTIAQLLYTCTYRDCGTTNLRKHAADLYVNHRTNAGCMGLRSSLFIPNHTNHTICVAIKHCCQQSSSITWRSCAWIILWIRNNDGLGAAGVHGASHRSTRRKQLRIEMVFSVSQRGQNSISCSVNCILIRTTGIN